MSVTLNVTFTRPNSAPAWADLIPPVPEEYEKTTFKDSGLITEHTVTINEHTVEHKFVFKDQDALQSFLSDPVMINYRVERDAAFDAAGAYIEFETIN
jgi:hypothetical protein